jgi:protein involved in polysaccharide export with SLBB domain
VSITPLFQVGLMGAVRLPGTYAIDPTADLIDEIQQAGGFTTDAKQSDVRIVRTGEVLKYNVERALEATKGTRVRRARLERSSLGLPVDSTALHISREEK